MSIEWIPGWAMTDRVFDDLRERLGPAVTPRRVLVGWSLGAQQALARARAEPRDVHALVLIAATPCFVQRDGWTHAMAPHVFDGFAASLRQDPAAAYGRFVSLQAQGDRKARVVMRTLRKSMSESDTAALEAGLEDLCKNDLRDALPRIRCRTLIVHGENDVLVPHAAAEYLAQRLPDARCDLVSGAGHAPFVSNAGHVAELIRAFIDG